jgi:hypothetical protein
MIVFARTMQLAQGTLEALNLALVVNLLTLGKLERLEHFLHLFQRMLQLLDDAVDLFNRVSDRRCLVWPHGLWRLASLFPFDTLSAFRVFNVFLVFGVLHRLVRHRFRGGVGRRLRGIRGRRRG